MALSDDEKNFIEYVSYILIMGLFASCVYVLFRFISKKPWSSYTILYALIPTFVSAVVYICARIWIKYEIGNDVRMALWKKAVSVILVITFLISIYLLREYTRVDYIHIALGDVSRVIDENGSIYVLYGSDNCVYCYQMEDIYEQAVLDSGLEDLYYVDLTYESTEQEDAAGLNINSIPLLVFYENGEEVKRLEGTAEPVDVVSFFETG